MTGTPDRWGSLVEPASPTAVVADAMLTRPQVMPARVTVGQVREVFADDHQHAVLVVDGDHLVAVVERADLPGEPDSGSAARVGRLGGRVVGSDANLNATWRTMVSRGRRRLAVVGDDGSLLGLLCLKRNRTGFCTEDDVRSRAADRERERTIPPPESPA